MKNRENKTKAELIKENEVLQEKVKDLEKSKDHFRIIAENTSDNIGITTFDLKAKYIYVSPSIKFVLGYDPEDLLGKSFFDFIHPEDKKVIFPLLKKYVNLKIKKLLTGKESIISETVDFRFKNKAGNWRFMQSTVNIIGKQLLAITRDVTERKNVEEQLKISEEKYRTLVENIQDGVFAIHDAKMLFVNKAFAIMTGYSEEKLIGMKFTNLIAPEDIDMVVNRYYRRQAGENVTSEYEFSMIHKDKTTRIIVNMNVGLFNYQNSVASIGTVRNITERKKAEEELEKHRDHLKELVEERTKELEEKNEKLKQFNKLFEGREFRIKDLKDRVKELEEKLGICDL